MLEMEFSSEFFHKTNEIRTYMPAHLGEPQTVLVIPPKRLSCNSAPNDNGVCPNDLQLETLSEDYVNPQRGTHGDSIIQVDHDPPLANISSDSHVGFTLGGNTIDGEFTREPRALSAFRESHVQVRQLAVSRPDVLHNTLRGYQWKLMNSIPVFIAFYHTVSDFSAFSMPIPAYM